ncbi:MAG TPA: deoxyribose-phosphate aldolase [Terriglobales bacterium]|jgi:deoxyribose-phosphate aldolase|nr:deoxyribose-phosphate aldolase [Terriglobales bacterium]
MSTHSPVQRASSAVDLDWRSVARLIDHTLLRADTTRQQVAQLCAEATHFGFAAVFAHPTYLAQAVAALHLAPVKVGTTVGFPLGAALTTVKRFESAEAVRLGADEIDMVLNVGALKSGDRVLVESDIRSVAEIAHRAGAILKVILETALLTRDEKVLACELAVSAGADFVKTSTGFAGGGATVEDIALMRTVVGERAGVKASGGIRTAADVAAMLNAGADRLGTSSGVAIMLELGAPPLKQ